MTGWIEAVADRFASVDPRLALVALALHVANHLLRSLAWRNVLAAAYPGREVRLVPVASAYAAGVAVNAATPARGGDALKVALARATLPGSSVATIAATMSVLVAFDVLAGTLLVVGVALGGVASFRIQEPDLPLPALATAVAAAGAGLLLAVRLARPRLVRLCGQLRAGGAILRTPGRYVRLVAAVQTCAWGCRIGVVFCLLAAFGLPASVPLAGLVMVLAGASAIVPLTPGGAGTQQVVLAYALSEAATAAAVVSFSIGMQVAVTAVNALLGVAAAMVICRTLRPIAAVRAGLRLARAPATS